MPVRPHPRDEAGATAHRASLLPRRNLIDGLNQDLANEHRAILMYLRYWARMDGPYRKAVRQLFQAQLAEEWQHARMLANRITALGGEPGTAPTVVPRAGRPRDMLERIVEAQKRAIADFDARIAQAEMFGDFTLQEELEDMIADEERHKEEVERLLDSWEG